MNITYVYDANISNTHNYQSVCASNIDCVSWEDRLQASSAGLQVPQWCGTVVARLWISSSGCPQSLSTLRHLNRIRSIIFLLIIYLYIYYIRT